MVTKDRYKLRVYFNPADALRFSGFGDYISVFNDNSGVVYQLYNLNTDPAEEKDIALEEPEKLKELTLALLKECDGNFVHGTPQAHFASSIV